MRYVKRNLKRKSFITWTYDCHQVNPSLATHGSVTVQDFIHVQDIMQDIHSPALLSSLLLLHFIAGL